ncbi:hypothetical protein [Neodiprion sertifer nucleopolyhedrovirus]|uniref:Chitin-binding type-2 domain-containing protein n=1 Tax=Neodiprion sertifer nucleopolyhedrovirus TaxID=111874 RepID=Q6JK93_9CBAC|nr:hypothetical protein NeseNPV_gp67 [Neodiprion sertifer nucleopolyhedrovirus]AAQ96444.1 hypothetical protein [Neodiprion sertifer nucleopolyhedrovirus]
MWKELFSISHILLIITLIVKIFLFIRIAQMNKFNDKKLHSMICPLNYDGLVEHPFDCGSAFDCQINKQIFCDTGYEYDPITSTCVEINTTACSCILRKLQDIDNSVTL